MRINNNEILVTSNISVVMDIGDLQNVFAENLVELVSDLIDSDNQSIIEIDKDNNESANSASE